MHHAVISAKKFGGKLEDYMPIHNFFDSSKACIADVRHRALLHSSFGIFLVEKVFGDYIVNSDGKRVSVRDIAEDHVIQDMGDIPSVNKWLETMPIQPWMCGPGKNKTKKITHISFED
jgi:hypothetical protein